MERRNSGIDERQEAAIALLVTGQKPSVVATKVGISDRTLRQWRGENRAFMSALAAAQAEVLRDGIARANGLLDDALDTVHEVLGDRDVPAAVRVRAAEIIIARTLDAKRETEAAVSAEDIATAFREYARQNPDEARRALDEAAE